MKCINEEIGQLMSLYEFGQLDKEKKEIFETHLLECDACFLSLHNLSRVVERMRENPELFLKALREPARISFFEVVKNWLEKTIAAPFQALERLPIWGKVAVPAAIAITISLLFILQPSKQLSYLARIEPVPYRPFQLKGATSASEAEQLFEEGMQFYVKEKYEQAVERLLLAVEKNPDNVSFQFYLGLSYLLAGKTDEAIEHLEKTIEQGDNSLLEKFHWYLGNAYLLKENGQRALVEFRKVVGMEGDYEWEAREIVDALKNSL